MEYSSPEVGTTAALEGPIGNLHENEAPSKALDDATCVICKPRCHISEENDRASNFELQPRGHAAWGGPLGWHIRQALGV